MSNAVFGYQNNVTRGVLSSLVGNAPGLDVSQLQNHQGSPSTAFQSVSTSASILIDSGTDATTWRAFLLARTNLTAGATVRWRVGSADALIEAAPAVSVGLASGIPVGWTYSRSSAATLAGAAGQIASYVANAPRITTQGLLIEGAATNLFGSNDSATTGQYSGNTIAAGGGSNYPGAATTQCTYAGPDSNLYYVGAGGLTSGQTYTASYWVWIPSSATLTGLTLAWEGNATNSIPGAANLALRDQFQRIWCVAQINATSSAPVLRITGAPSGTVIYVCAKQVEAGPAPTSYIHTTGGNAASRAADALNTTAGVAAACASGSYTLQALAAWAVPPASTTRLDVVLQNSTAPGTTATARFDTLVEGIAFGGTGVETARYSQGYPSPGSSRAVVAISPGGIGFASLGNAAQSRTGLPSALLPDTLAVATANNASVFLAAVGLYASRLSDAQITSLATNGVTATGAVVYDSGTAAAGVQPGFGQSFVTAGADVAGRVCRLDISDPNNPDGFINVPLAYAGPVWSPLTNMSYETTFGRDDQVDEVVSRGGSEFPTLQWARRRWDVSLQGVRQSEVWTQAMALDLAARAGGNVLFVPDPAGANVGQEAVFGRLKSLADLSFPFGSADRRAWKARITERL